MNNAFLHLKVIFSCLHRVLYLLKGAFLAKERAPFFCNIHEKKPDGKYGDIRYGLAMGKLHDH